MVCDWSFHSSHHFQKDFVGCSSISVYTFCWLTPCLKKLRTKKIQFDNACVVKEAVYSTLILFCSWSQFLFLLYAVLAKTQCTHNFKKGANFGRFDCVIFSGEENKITFRKHTFAANSLLRSNFQYTCQDPILRMNFEEFTQSFFTFTSHCAK